MKSQVNISMMKKMMAAVAVAAMFAGLSAFADDAKAVFDKNCAKCHGVDGKGETKVGKKLGIKDLTDAKIQGELKDEKAFKSIKEGLKDGEKTLMKAAEGLSDDQIKDLVAYIRKFKN